MTGNPEMWLALVAGLLFVLMLFAGTVRFVPQGWQYTIERFGRYHRTVDAGLALKWPLFERVGSRQPQHEQVLQIDVGVLRTSDNVELTVSAVVFFQIVHAAKAAYEVDDLRGVLEQAVGADLRMLYASVTLDVALARREQINTKLLAALDGAADAWGIRVVRAEVADVVPPPEVAAAAAREAEALRLKRAAMAAAEGERQAEITRAEKDHQAALLRAEAHKREAVMEAEARERVAEAEARSAMMVSEAIHRGDAQALRFLLAREYIDTLRSAAGAGNVRVVMLPMDMGLAGGLAPEGGAPVAQSSEAIVRAAVADVFHVDDTAAAPDGHDPDTADRGDPEAGPARVTPIGAFDPGGAGG